MRFKTMRLAGCVALATSGMFFPIMTHASVTGVSVSETAEADPSDISTHTTLPPKSIVAANSDDSDSALVDINTYVGPSGAGLSTPTLTLDGNVITSEEEGQSTSATITYKFDLDATQPYSYSNLADDFDDFVTFTGPGGDVATGSGSLSPGDYTLTATQTSEEEGLAEFNLSVAAPVPEPSSIALVGLAGAALLTRRRKA